MVFHRIGRSRQRRVHANVALVAGERPEDDAPLHGLWNAVVALLDALERQMLRHNLRTNIEQHVGRWPTRAAMFHVTQTHFGNVQSVGRHEMVARAAAARRSARGGHSLSSGHQRHSSLPSAPPAAPLPVAPPFCTAAPLASNAIYAPRHQLLTGGAAYSRLPAPSARRRAN